MLCDWDQKMKYVYYVQPFKGKPEKSPMAVLNFHLVPHPGYFSPSWVLPRFPLISGPTMATGAGIIAQQQKFSHTHPARHLGHQTTHHLTWALCSPSTLGILVSSELTIKPQDPKHKVGDPSRIGDAAE